MSDDEKATALAIHKMHVDGCSVITVSDGKVLLMTSGWLRTMLQMAEADESRSIACFLQSVEPSAPEVNN